MGHPLWLRSHPGWHRQPHSSNGDTTLQSYMADLIRPMPLPNLPSSISPPSAMTSTSPGSAAPAPGNTSNVPQPFSRPMEHPFHQLSTHQHYQFRRADWRRRRVQPVLPNRRSPLTYEFNEIDDYPQKISLSRRFGARRHSHEQTRKPMEAGDAVVAALAGAGEEGAKTTCSRRTWPAFASLSLVLGRVGGRSVTVSALAKTDIGRVILSMALHPGNTARRPALSPFPQGSRWRRFSTTFSPTPNTFTGCNAASRVKPRSKRGRNAAFTRNAPPAAPSPSGYKAIPTRNVPR